MAPMEDHLPPVLALADPRATLEHVGGKGASLARMAQAGLPIPPGFHITTAAYRRFVNENGLRDTILAIAAAADPDDPATLDAAAAEIQARFAAAAMPADLAATIRAAYDAFGSGDLPVAVRSSATAEDLPELSFAGQQDSYLNVCGADQVLDAVKRCWASLWTARAIGYRARHAIPSDEVSLAVVVQALVPAVAAGILFTANPVSGARDQIMINAAWGLGEAIVGGLVTPDTIVVDKTDGRIVQQMIAAKAAMTVRTAQGTREAPVPADRRTEPTLTPEQIAELRALGQQIEQLYDQPMDIEWASDGATIAIVQARPITALPDPANEPQAAPTLEWTLPDPKRRYLRGSVIELLPDPLSPLFATLALPIWSRALRDLATSVGVEAAVPPDALTTINGYAYYSLGFSAVESVKLTLATIRALPAVGRLIGPAQQRWAHEGRPTYITTVDRWAAHDLRAASAVHLLSGVQAIVEAAAAHYLTIQSGILPAAYMSETLFTLVYNKFIKRAGDPPALTFLLGFDSTPIQAEKSLYDLAQWARSRPDLAAYLTRTPAGAIAYDSAPPPHVEADSWYEFSRRFGLHLQRFGHTIYDLDFAKAVPADDPAPLLDALKFFVSGAAPDPHLRQATAATARDRATGRLLRRLRGVRLVLFWRLLRWARRFAPLREDALADVGLGWPIVRRMLREVGRRLVEAGSLEQPDDVFFLRWDELDQIAQRLDTNQPIADQRAIVRERQRTWDRQRVVAPPVALPLKGAATFFGIDFTSTLPARAEQADAATISGIGTSPGHVTGPARVIRGPEEFNQMQAGDVLVAKITTPAWTPLFARAGGVVTDVGGPLSHSSIVAREYGIPAVLGTGVATERLRSGQTITVDGDAGTVTPAS